MYGHSYGTHAYIFNLVIYQTSRCRQSLLVLTDRHFHVKTPLSVRLFLLLAFQTNFTKKQTYQVSLVTYWFGFPHVLIRFLLKRKNYFRGAS